MDLIHSVRSVEPVGLIQQQRETSMVLREFRAAVRFWLSNRRRQRLNQPARLVGAKSINPDGIGAAGVAGRVAPSQGNRHGDLPSPSLEAHPWAAGAAFETSVRFLDEGGALRAEAPRVGEVARLELHDPFQGRLGQPFWALYEHPSGFWNGYLDGPGEARHLAAMRFVRCRLMPRTTLPAPGSYETLTLEAEILAVLGPDDLLALPPSNGSAEAAIDSVNWHPQTNSDGRLRIIDSNMESDVVNWLLLATVGGHVHLLACGESLFHAAAVAFGNRPLTEAEIAKLAPFSSVAPQPHRRSQR